MKQKKNRKGFIPEDVLEEVHPSENFIGINLRTDIRMIHDNLKAGQEINPALLHICISKFYGSMELMIVSASTYSDGVSVSNPICCFL